jgi:thiol peroxidase
MPITLHDTPVDLEGTLPVVEEKIKDAIFSNESCDEKLLSTYLQDGKKVILYFVPSVDTPVCNKSIVEFSKRAGEAQNCKLICISIDTPFAQTRFAKDKQLTDVVFLSSIRNIENLKKYGVYINSSILEKFATRCVVGLDEMSKVIYVELVPEISHEPNYDSAMKAITNP